MTDAAPGDSPARPFNSPIECGFRSLFIAAAVAPRAFDVQRMVSYDYLLVHSGDVPEGPYSLHPAVPFRGGEWLVRRDAVAAGLDLMYSRELLHKDFTRSGIVFTATPLTSPFIKLLIGDYASSLRSRAEWVATRFADVGDDALASFMTENVGRWGAEFERLTALRDLEL